MKLKFVLAELDINNRIDFKSLSDINQTQLLVGLCKCHGKKISIGKALTLNFRANYWTVVEENNFDEILCEFWEINDVYGICFHPNSILIQCICLNGQFIHEEECSKKPYELIKNLQVAERLHFEKYKFILDESDQVKDFMSARFIPDSISKWRSLLKRIKLSQDFIHKYSKYFDKKCWRTIGQYSELNIDSIRIYGKKFGWYMISTHQNLSRELITEFCNELDWKLISKNRKLSESFIREFSDLLSWDEISIYQELSLNFVREFRSKINFRLLKVKSIDFVYEFECENLNWLHVVNNFDVDEIFIRKFLFKLDANCWSIISKKCELSTSFICEHTDKIDWFMYSQNAFITCDQLLLFKEKIDWNVLSRSGSCIPEDTLILVEDFINNQGNDARVIWQNIFKNVAGFSISDSYKLTIAKIFNSIN